MSMLDNLQKREIKEILSKGWITHDAMWFAHSLEAVGIEKTNAINQSAVKSMSMIETMRLKKVLGYTKETVDTFNELAELTTAAFDLILADFMRFKITVPEKNVIHWQMEKDNCFAFKGISRMGVIDQYDCGVLTRIKTWLATLKVDFTMSPEVTRCIMHTRGECCGDFLFNLV